MTIQANTTPNLLEALRNRILVADGAMGTMLQAAELTLDDFLGLEGCNEILNETRPDVVRGVHDAYFAAGSDMVETNTFGTNFANFAEYDIVDRIGDLAYKAAVVARESADAASTEVKPRWVLGSMGPGTKLPTLGHAPYATLRDAYAEQADGMLAGGVDAVIVETCQDLLQAKAAIVGAKRAMKSTREVPIVCSVTVETTGSMLLGSEIGAALVALEPLGIDLISLNCATGPAEMSEHLRYLSQHSRIPLAVMPNAGLPELGPDGAVYSLTPDDLAAALRRFVLDYGVSLVGGCCGTTPEHIAQLSAAVSDLAPVARQVNQEPSVASLYQPVPFRQDSSVLMIGERTNANGSRAFRDAMLEARHDDCVEIARSQARDGSHILDLCVDYVGRDGVADMRTFAGAFATASTLPIVLDSTEPAVIEAGLEMLGGRSVVNSVNYEDGDGPDSRFARIMPLVKEHGAAVVALTIDEEGQARTAEWKVRVACRLIEELTGVWGMALGDIVVDTLTFPIATGQEETRRDAIETIEAIKELKRRYPQVQTTLGVSNVSFGLNPAARQVLNSVFLHECVEAGLTSAIVHSSKILPMSRIDEEHRTVALDMIYDRRRDGYDPLQRFLELFEGVSAQSSRETRAAELAALPLEERLQRRIVEGEPVGLEADLDEALKTTPAMAIINETLLSGMKTVGELFGSGQMQLPFVLQSAEVMKTAVAYLEPHLEKADASGKGKIVLATVKGDVHDIGKNLVDIILSNNGYSVVNLGIKQPINTILDAAQEHDADVIGMSGLLVKSTVIMRDNLSIMNEKGVAARWPVLLGGAALTRAFVEQDLDDMYAGDVRYARDAFEGLKLMDAIMLAKRGETSAHVRAEEEKAAAERKARRARSQRIAAERRAEVSEPDLYDASVRSDVVMDNPIPTPPFWGSRVMRGIPLADYVSLLDERATFMGQWGLRGARGGSGPSYEELVETEGRPRLRYWLDRLQTDHVLEAAVVYGYFPCVSDGNDLIVLDRFRENSILDSSGLVLTPETSSAPELVAEDRPRERCRFRFPRQRRDRRLCLADFFRARERPESDGAGRSRPSLDPVFLKNGPVTGMETPFSEKTEFDEVRQEAELDVVAFQIATIGSRIGEYANELFEANAYRDYLEVHGLSVQLAEALAEYWHSRVRKELVFSTGTSAGDDDPSNPQGFFDLEYRGARYSFGYPACPNLEDQTQLFELLDPGRIGVKLSEEYQLHPEQSTSAMIVHHPEAKYFAAK